MQQRVTLADVASEAGVNVSTVSRCLNPDTSKQVSVAMVKKVNLIAKRLGYTPNTVARGLRTKKSMTIGVIVPDLTNPIFPPIVRGIDSVLSERGYSAFVVNTDNNQEYEEKLFDSLIDRQVDGFIIATGHAEIGQLAKYFKQGIKTVMVNREAINVATPSVIGDDAAGIHAAVSHLVDLDHQRILHLSGPTNFSTSKVRTKAFQESCRTLKVAGEIIKSAAYSIDSGYLAMNKYLKGNGAKATAVVAGNDLLALGVYHALREHGLDCPKDVSVIGFNNMPFTPDFQPAMTTVASPHYEMGEEAARLLLDQIDGREIGAMKITLPVNLVIRSSTAHRL
jgi:LacI family transcriptional regulator